MTDVEFNHLATLYLEDAIDTEALDRLNLELANSPERVRAFNDLRMLTGALSELRLKGEATPIKKVYRPPFIWLAAAACLILVMSLWLNHSPRVTPGNPFQPSVPQLATTMLAPGWSGESRGAKFTIVGPGRVRLDQGELHVKSVAMNAGEGERAPLSIETEAAVATAKGTEFFVGNHNTQHSNKENNMKILNPMRVLVLSGIVTLSNQFGAVAGEAKDLMVATADTAPVKETVKANSQFAVDLYKQVIKENRGKNVFFSPYSISSALAMTVEGARGETAAEMSRVLHFPIAAKRQGNDAQLIPWRSSLIHTGFEQLNNELDRASNNPNAAQVRKQLEALRVELAKAKAFTQKSEELKAIRASAEKERALIREINELASQIDQFELNIANAIWAEKTLDIEKPYRDTVSKHYGTGAFRAGKGAVGLLHMSDTALEGVAEGLLQVVPRFSRQGSLIIVGC